LRGVSAPRYASPSGGLSRANVINLAVLLELLFRCRSGCVGKFDLVVPRPVARSGGGDPGAGRYGCPAPTFSQLCYRQEVRNCVRVTAEQLQQQRVTYLMRFRTFRRNNRDFLLRMRAGKAGERGRTSWVRRMWPVSPMVRRRQRSALALLERVSRADPAMTKSPRLITSRFFSAARADVQGPPACHS
jgi:hypothetical protein